ncbi:aromatic ring-hydroxylating oxygenase subunit alpha [Pseudomonas sp. 5P_3.1_Bac2]|uniref:aromatic ring-hydroxylating oxygenase subunit alpha n=1 Tax=Pseudomonas sp. 5P_3.1_Bac2 TaxID=2971617 RepID=UPI0021C9C376|nr:SRPBCC family protein [Pseudomonas sp. 5P_3.1_Bac2]MCU1717286.1 Rieske 2Fe-2S domain-containing protein [Pseudomonas sp. 5P_3.1_Bac2]
MGINHNKVAAMVTRLHGVAGLPEAQAQCLPGQFYSCPDFYQFEVESFLKKEWHCVGRVDELAEAGDFFTTQLFEEPLILIKGDEGTIRALSNLCRHRGMPLAEGKGHTRRFVCSYHAWSYERDGRLAHAPRMQEKGVTPHSCSLPEFKTELWNGFIYVNLDDNAAPLATRLGNLEALLANYQTAEMRHVHSQEEIWNTNWKCLVENFMEAYHLSVVHPKTLHPYTPTGLSRKSMADEAFTSYCANYPDSAASRGLGAPGLSAEERRRSTLFCLFPTQLVSQAATLLVSLSIQPLAVDQIRVRWTVATYGEELSAAELDERLALWNEVNREDREKLERMQRGLASRHAPSGQLSPADFEGTICDFYRYLSRSLSSHIAVTEL